MLKKSLFILAASLCLATAASAADGNEKAVRDAVQSLGADIHIDSVEPAPMPGFYQVMASGRLVYVSADGKYMMNGDVIDIGGKQNLTEAAWARTRGRGRTQSDHHGIHRCRLRVLPRAAQTHRRIQQTGNRGAVPVLATHRRQDHRR